MIPINQVEGYERLRTEIVKSAVESRKISSSNQNVFKATEQIQLKNALRHFDNKTLNGTFEINDYYFDVYCYETSFGDSAEIYIDLPDDAEGDIVLLKFE